MKAIRVFVFGLGLGLCAAIAACSSAPRCNVSNCAGCCESNGLCQEGKSNLACGTRGELCLSCTNNQVCGTSFTCVGGNTGGGAGGGTGGAGGFGGAGGGTGGTGGTGGAGGGSSGACNATTCPSGCCSGSACIAVASQSNTVCGQFGQTCVPCTTGNTCQSGACTGQSCSAATCAGGCCNGNTCVAYVQQTNGNCGASGASCAACPGTQTCSTGVCITNASVGSPCANNTQCASLGAGATCKLTTSSGSGPYPGGTCTKPCTSALNCPGATTCLGGVDSVLPYYGEYDKFCAPTCAVGGVQGTCRAGEFCYDLSVAEGTACWLDVIPPFDGGGFPDKLGSACTLDTQCANPPSPDFGFCQLPLTAAGAPTGFTNGYCMADCSLDNTDKFCGGNGECFGFNAGQFFLCMRTCATPGGGFSTLRANNQYVCRKYTQADGGTSKGYLWPACNQAGITCPGNTFCNAANGYCCDGGFCIN